MDSNRRLSKFHAVLSATATHHATAIGRRLARLPQRRRHRLRWYDDLPVDLTINLLLLLELLPLDLVSQCLQVGLADRVDARAHRLEGLGSGWQTGDSRQAQSTDNGRAMPFHCPSPYRWAFMRTYIVQAAGRSMSASPCIGIRWAAAAAIGHATEFPVCKRNGPPEGSPFQCTAGRLSSHHLTWSEMFLN